jgi:hypothetical protein
MARTKTGGKRFFLKNEAKTFANWRWLPWRRQPQVEKFFGSFFQKRTASFPSCLTPPNQLASMPGNGPRKPNPK